MTPQNTLTPQEIEERAGQVFNDHPKAQEVLVVTDGSCFLPHAHNLAHDHARRHGLEVKVVKRNPDPDAPAADAPHPVSTMTVADVKNYVEGITDVSELEAALLHAATKGAVDAINARINLLKSQAQ